MLKEITMISLTVPSSPHIKKMQMMPNLITFTSDSSLKITTQLEKAEKKK